MRLKNLKILHFVSDQIITSSHDDDDDDIALRRLSTSQR